MTREEAIATVPVGWRFLIERLSTRTCKECGCNGGRCPELDGETVTLCDSCQLLRGFRAEQK